MARQIYNVITYNADEEPQNSEHTQPNHLSLQFLFDRENLQDVGNNEERFHKGLLFNILIPIKTNRIFNRPSIEGTGKKCFESICICIHRNTDYILLKYWKKGVVVYILHN